MYNKSMERAYQHGASELHPSMLAGLDKHELQMLMRDHNIA